MSLFLHVGRIAAITATLVSVGQLRAQDGPSVTEASIATAVRDRTPQNAGETFPSNVGTLYCFTWIVGAEPNSYIDHVWFFGDQEVARTSLSIGAASWRTWSSKTIPAGATGAWRVDVTTKDGTVLTTLNFTIE